MQAVNFGRNRFHRKTTGREFTEASGPARTRSGSRALAAAMLAVLVFAASGCSSARQPEIPTVPYVDLSRFMGTWYVVANIPTRTERNAYNSVESYALEPDGTIKTTFTFRKDGFSGEEKRYTPRGFVLDTRSNALWGMQFVWPVKAEFRIIYLSDDYSTTIIGRNKRDYVWIMRRTPTLSNQDYGPLLRFLNSVGYDLSKIQRVPQRWDER